MTNNDAHRLEWNEGIENAATDCIICANGNIDRARHVCTSSIQTTYLLCEPNLLHAAFESFNKSHFLLTAVTYCAKRNVTKITRASSGILDAHASNRMNRCQWMASERGQWTFSPSHRETNSCAMSFGVALKIVSSKFLHLNLFAITWLQNAARRTRTAHTMRSPQSSRQSSTCKNETGTTVQRTRKTNDKRQRPIIIMILWQMKCVFRVVR